MRLENGIEMNSYITTYQGVKLYLVTYNEFVKMYRQGTTKDGYIISDKKNALIINNKVIGYTFDGHKRLVPAQIKKDWKEVLMATARYNTYLEEYLKQDNLPLKMYEGCLSQGKVNRIISFDKDENWNDAIIVRTQTQRIYVPVYQLHKQNLEGKTVYISGGDGGITR